MTVEFKGHDMTYFVRCADMDVQADSMSTERFAEGSEVCLSVIGM